MAKTENKLHSKRNKTHQRRTKIIDITVEPEIYYPIIDNTGNYMDKCPAFIKHGIKCPCGARDNWVYDSTNPQSEC